MDPERRHEARSQATPVRERYLAQRARFRRSEAIYQRAEAQYRELMRSRPGIGPGASSVSPTESETPGRIVLGPADRVVPKSQHLSASESTESDAGRLTKRQQEVAGLLAAGYTNKQIAELLVVTPGTVANHVAHMLDRLNLRNRSQIGVWAVRHGLYDPNLDALAAPDELRRSRAAHATGPTVPQP